MGLIFIHLVIFLFLLSGKCLFSCIGSCLVSLCHFEEAREVMRAHLDRFKWKEAALNTEQLRSNRWMIGASPKASACPAELRRCLTVTPQSQVMHLKLIINIFVEGGRRLRPSARSRLRMSSDVFDAHADYACIYSALLVEARQLASFTPEKEAQIMKAFYQRSLGCNL